MSSELWRRFHDWVEGVGPRPENEVIPPEPPPDLPFTPCSAMPVMEGKRGERKVLKRKCPPLGHTHRVTPIPPSPGESLPKIAGGASCAQSTGQIGS